MLVSRVGCVKLLLLYFYVTASCQYLAAEVAHDYFNAKHALVNKLTKNSDIMKEILPVPNASTPVDLKFHLALQQIATVDEVNQAIRLIAWLRLYWNNPFLQWEPSQYQGINSVHVDSEMFWTPDIALFNQASLEEDIEILYKRLATKLVIKNNGSCTWLAPATLFSQCKINVSRFPFDNQECLVIFGSWTYSEKKIAISYKEEKVDLKKFIPNGEWEVISASLKNNLHYYGSDNTPYPDVTFHLRIKRRPLYYGLNLIIPCALIALLSFISFILPSDHGERVSLVITVLLANSVYMLIVSSSLPETSDGVPLIGIYFLCIIIEIALCLFATCLTVKIRVLKTEMPQWVENLINKRLARFVFVESEATFAHKHMNGDLAVIQNEKFRKIPDSERRYRVNSNGGNRDEPDVELIETGIASKEDVPEQLHEKLQSEFRLLADEVRKRRAKEMVAKKWKRAAKVLDRFFLFIFLLIYVCLTGYLLGSM